LLNFLKPEEAQKNYDSSDIFIKKITEKINQLVPHTKLGGGRFMFLKSVA